MTRHAITRGRNTRGHMTRSCTQSASRRTFALRSLRVGRKVRLCPGAVVLETDDGLRRYGTVRPAPDHRHGTRSLSSPPMKIQQARLSDASMIASVLQEAAQWLANGGRALWSTAETSHERVLRDTGAGLFHVARDGEQLAGVMKFELEDACFWPEVLPGSSAFVHKLAVR